MANLTPQQIANLDYQAGFRGRDLTTAVEIAEAESGGNPRGYNTAGNSAGADRGLYQINNYYHAEVSDQCAYDPLCATQAAFRIYSQSGDSFRQWSSYENGSYQRYAGEASSVSVPGNAPKVAKPWWQFPTSQGFGQNGETGNDIATPFHTPVATPFGGVVTAAGYHPYGGEVDVATTIPGFGRITEYFLHLDSISSNIIAGAQVSAGELLGLSGGENPGYPGALHPALPAYSSGPHIEFGLINASGGNPNPTSVVAGLRSGTLSSPSMPLPDASSVAAQGLTAVGSTMTSPLISIPGIFDPSQWINGIGDGIKNNLEALANRMGLVVGGFLLLLLGIIVLVFSNKTVRQAAVDVAAAP